MESPREGEEERSICAGANCRLGTGPRTGGLIDGRTFLGNDGCRFLGDTLGAEGARSVIVARRPPPSLRVIHSKIGLLPTPPPAKWPLPVAVPPFFSFSRSLRAG
jgi:hypothetical protein